MAAWLICLVTTGQLQAANHDAQPRDVEVKATLIDIEEVNSVAQNFTANLAITLRWQDKNLAHSGPDSISRPLTEIWHPNIQILNQQRVVMTFPQIVEILPDGTAIYRQRYWGSFSQPLELGSFPFDSQVLRLTLVNVGFGTHSVSFLSSEESGISKQFSLPDWSVTGWEFTTLDLPYETDAAQINGIELSLDVKRDTNYFKYKVILPLILIVMMSWMVFWIDPSLVASQISVSVTAMLTMIAYRFALAGYIPKLGYLTSLDIFVVVSTLAVFIAMLEVIFTAYLATNNRLDTARRIDRQARWLVPFIYLALAADTLYFRFLFNP